MAANHHSGTPEALGGPRERAPWDTGCSSDDPVSRRQSLARSVPVASAERLFGWVHLAHLQQTAHSAAPRLRASPPGPPGSRWPQLENEGDTHSRLALLGGFAGESHGAQGWEGDRPRLRS